MDFCQLCGSFLVKELDINGINKKCFRCNAYKEAKAEDTLMFTEYIKKKKENINKELLKTGSSDNTNISIYKQCSKCEFQIVKMVFIGDMQAYYLCEHCNNIFQ